MGDKGYYYAKISMQEHEIEEHNNEIHKKNQQISELSSLKSKVSQYMEHFDEIQRNRRNNLSLTVGELFSRKRYSQKVIQSYEQGMSDLLSGSEQHQIMNGIFSAEETIEAKIRRNNEEIEECFWQISRCNAKITDCRKEIKRITERERGYGKYSY